MQYVIHIVVNGAHIIYLWMLGVCGVLSRSVTLSSGFVESRVWVRTLVVARVVLQHGILIVKNHNCFIL